MGFGVNNHSKYSYAIHQIVLISLSSSSLGRHPIPLITFRLPLAITVKDDGNDGPINEENALIGIHIHNGDEYTSGSLHRRVKNRIYQDAL